MKNLLNRGRTKIQSCIGLCILCILSHLNVLAQGDQTKITVSTNSSGGTTGAWLHLPGDYNSTSEKYPLVIFFHGIGERGTNLDVVLNQGLPKAIANGAKMDFVVNGKTEKLITVCPQNPDNGWTKPAMVDAILKDIISKYRIDENRIYLTGLSAGGFAVWGYVAANMTYSSKIAAIVPVSAAPIDDPSGLCNIAQNNVAVWTLCGDQDSFYGTTLDYIDRINACNPKTAPKLTTYAGMGHSSAVWDRAYSADHTYLNPNIYEWMLGFSRAGSTTPTNQSPVANSGGSATVTLPANSLVLDASASSDADGSIVSFAWKQTGGPNTASISNANTSKATASGLIAGTYTFSVTVTDDDGATATASKTVTVNAASNQAPIANAGQNISLQLPTASTTLNGSGSSDPDGSISKYAWQQVSGPNTSAIASPNSASTNISGLIAGTYLYSLTVTDNQSKTATANVSVTVAEATTQPGSCDCDFEFGPDSDGGIYVDLSSRGVQPGDRVCIKAGKYKYIQFFNFSGTAAQPITFINCGGQVFVGDGGNYGINFNNAKFFKITGTGTTDKYGFVVSTTGTYLSSGFAAGKGCSDYEVDHIEISHAEAGMLCKVNPDCDPNNWYPNFEIRNIKFHDLYIHDVLGEGMYIGNTAQNGMEVTCDGVTKMIPPPRIYNVEIYNCITNNTGWDGIQLSAAPEGAYIHDNYVSNYGLENKGSQQAGIIFGGESVGSVYNNIVEKGTGNGMQIFGGDLVKVYNNLVIDAGFDGTSAGQDAILVDDKPTNYLYKGIRVYMFNNTVIRSGRAGIAFFNSKGTVGKGNLFYNNLVVAPGAGTSSSAYINISNTVDYTSGNNLNIANIADAKFVNAGGNDFHLTASSPAVDKGYNAATYGVNIDLDNNARPSGSAFDIGAYEFVSGSTPVNKPPVANAGGAITITLPDESVTLDGSASSDPDGTIKAFAWKQVSGPGTATIASPAANKTLVSKLVEGTYTFSLTVTDDDNASNTVEVKVTVNPAANKAPVANAGSDQTITLPTNTVTLDAVSSTDADGFIQTFSWQQISGPSTATFSLPNASKTPVYSLTVGTYVFEVTVTDNDGATAKDQVSVTVNPAVNKAPIANAGTDITITLPTNTASLNGEASQDQDGTVESYLWSQVAGPNTATFENKQAALTAISGLVEGTYSFQLIVTDNGGAKDTADVNVTVKPEPNKVPVADAGNDITITLPAASTTLDGSKSYDADGNIQSYTWKKVSGPSYAIANPNSAKTLISNLSAGTYVFELTVADDKGATAKDQVTVTVQSSQNTAPVANAGDDKSITLPTNSINLNGTASTDSDGSIVSYSWNKISGGNAYIVQTTAAQTAVTGLEAGTYVFELTVKDDDGATASDKVSVTVLPATNQAPVANAGADQSISLPTNSVTLNADQSSDSDGSILSYSWTKVSGGNAYINAPNSVSTSVTGLTTGTYVFELTVTDNNGATAKDQVKITVQAAANQAPVAKAGNDITITLPTNSTTLNGSQSNDPDGTIASYAWRKVSGGAVNIATPNAAVTSINGLVEGTYVFELTVKDNNGAIATDNITVVVKAVSNQAPVANAGSDQSITLPNNSVTLNGTASSDPDGSIVSYSWVKISGAAITISSPSNASTQVSGLAEGEYIFELTVKDNNGASSKDQVKVTVNAVANKPPVSIPGANITISLSEASASLDGTASYDPDGSIVKYEWTILEGDPSAIISTPTAAKASINFTKVGKYTVELAVTDNGNLVAKNTIVVEVLNLDNTLEVNLFPNPAVEYIRLQIKTHTIKDATLWIYDNKGVPVIKQVIGSASDNWQGQVDVSALPAGMYFVHIVGAEGLQYKTKFVKVK